MQHISRSETTLQLITPCSRNYQPRLETAAMPCARSLNEEFTQYREALKQLGDQMQRRAKQKADTALTAPLDEIKQTLSVLDRFVPQNESSVAIHYMAERASSLIDRVRQQCDSSVPV
jgi:hypothetical protein